MTAAEWVFRVVKETSAFSIGAKFFNSVGIGHLTLFNKGGIALAHLVHDYLKLGCWVGVIEKATIGMRAHCTSAE
jgi:hypothetical protein